MSHTKLATEQHTHVSGPVPAGDITLNPSVQVCLSTAPFDIAHPKPGVTLVFHPGAPAGGGTCAFCKQLIQ
jgi:hypothetical protein